MWAADAADPMHVGPPIGRFYAWWQGDPLPEFPPLPALIVEVPAAPRRTTVLTGLALADAVARLAAGHQPYVALVGSEVVAHGWSAGREAEISSANLAFRLPPGNRYLWDFVTLPAWRGRGLYPRLLQAILARERLVAERFWVGHDWENVASARGIQKSGFQEVGELAWLPSASLIFRGRGEPARSAAAAQLLGVALLVAAPIAGEGGT